MTKTWGPQVPVCEQTHADKYRQRGESFRAAMTRIASTLADNEEHFQAIRDIMLEQRFMAGGRIQAAIGTTKNVTANNCYVSGTIEDSLVDGHGNIMERAAEAARTMRMGGGIGFDFSPLRPRNELIRTLDSNATGPVSFMGIYNAVGLTISSSGHRRGAMMAVLRVDHPDIEEFIYAKQNSNALTGFNISIAITDKFMHAVANDAMFQLTWGGRNYRQVKAVELWDAIMRSTYDWSEPGVLFIDTINRMNNLSYCETIAATNPCGEQPLPPYGACLLGSINLVKYLSRDSLRDSWRFDYRQLFLDIPHIVRAMDNVINTAKYPLHEQQQEAYRKRRMGLGITGTANAIEALGPPYGSTSFIAILNAIEDGIKNAVYSASARLAKEKGSFPLYDAQKYLRGKFIQNLAGETQELIAEYGIRNSHLLSIAPTGTISLAADNISSGIEPVFAYETERLLNTREGMVKVIVEDYAYRNLGIKGKTVEDCTADDHLRVLATSSLHVDSAVSKTCNVPKDISWEAFKDIYYRAWKSGCKGCTAARKGNLRGAILVSKDEDEASAENLSCKIDAVTGRMDCE